MAESGERFIRVLGQSGRAPTHSLRLRALIVHRRYFVDQILDDHGGRLFVLAPVLLPLIGLRRDRLSFPREQQQRPRGISDLRAPASLS